MSLQQLACGPWPVRSHVLLHNACRRRILNKFVQYLYMDNDAGECHRVMAPQNTMTHALFRCKWVTEASPLPRTEKLSPRIGQLS